jgi:nitrile hydratase accessory protein
MTLNDLPALPRDKEGPVFDEPWEAQAFALAVCLSELGCFTWPEWVAILSQEIKAAQERGDPDLGNTYYQHWLNALERICAEAEALRKLRHSRVPFCSMGRSTTSPTQCHSPRKNSQGLLAACRRDQGETLGRTPSEIRD